MNSYEDKIKNALLFIESNLSKELHWKEISRHCGISEFHFHRIFSSRMQETPREYIIRRRLEKALGKIAYRCSEINLVDVAFECGYSSQSNFNKAFKAYFGVTPGQVIQGNDPKNSKLGKIKSKYGKDFSIASLYPDQEIIKDHKEKEKNMKVEIKEFEERNVVYAVSKQGYKQESVFNTWNQLMTSLATLGNPVDTLQVFGVGHDNPQVTPEEKCRYYACVLKEELTSVPNNTLETKFPKGRYACFNYKGPSDKLIQFYLDIYKSWFSNNGEEPGDFPLIENYLFVDKENPGADMEVETQFLLV
jgi:AraC family transcriptional regulator